MTSPARRIQLDTLVIGGGIAGIWVSHLLHRRGYEIALLEATALGSGQTLGSQGMIHGGLKYALGGVLTGASEAIAHMPDRWRACLNGRDPVDLTGVRPLSDHYYLFAEANSLGRLTTFFASRALRGRVRRLRRASFPVGLRDLDGVVYELDDLVLDTAAVLERLGAPVADRVFRHRVEPSELARTDSGWRFRPGSGREVHATTLVLCAGAGNGELASGLGLADAAMQLRPLNQVLVRHPGLPPLYAHCLTGISRAEPRLTITSHPDPQQPGRWLWYLGGQLATDGVDVSDETQRQRARAELSRCVRWLDWSGVQLECLRWDRAEPARAGGRRPDEAFVAVQPGALVCWPTKLSLAPDLGDRVLAALPAPAGTQKPAGDLGLPRAAVAPLPWGRA